MRRTLNYKGVLSKKSGVLSENFYSSTDCERPCRKKIFCGNKIELKIKTVMSEERTTLHFRIWTLSYL